MPAYINELKTAFTTSKMNIYVKAIIGGSLLMLIYFIFPPLFGEGYDSVKLVANGTSYEYS